MMETYCPCDENMFGFLSPSLISPNGIGGAIKARATYISEAMKVNNENRLFFAPYKYG